MGVGGKDSGGGAGDMIEYGNKALDLQKQIYDQQRTDTLPWYNTGSPAVSQLGTLLGLKNAATPDKKSVYDEMYGQGLLTNTPGKASDLVEKEYQKRLSASKMFDTGSSDYGTLSKPFSTQDFQTDPGYQFRLSEGQKALDRQLNARGKTYSPEAAKALMGYNQDMGTQEYNNAYNRFNINQDNLFNRLATLSGFGQTASGQMANSGSNYANAGSELYTGMGNAITAANQAKAANKGSMFNTLVGAGAMAGSAGGDSFFGKLLSDKRLKTDIELVDEKNGHNRYSFRYIHSPDKKYLGVMAQEVLEKLPEAVLTDSEGYYMVNYDKIGFPMEVIDAS